jgi:putative transposase
MPRRARIVIPDCPHHLPTWRLACCRRRAGRQAGVTQRGNRREEVFFTDADRQRYLALLNTYADTHGLAIHAYCLMSNHLHLVATPRTQASLAGALRPVFLRYAQHVNWTQQLSGRLWQGRFFSCPLDERHFWEAVRYACLPARRQEGRQVERNPVRARVVRKAERYPWSSAAAHCGLRADPLLADAEQLSQRVGDWSAWLREGEDEAMVSSIRRSTRTGRPAGSDGFIARLERLLGRALRPKKGGRPRKHKK